MKRPPCWTPEERESLRQMRQQGVIYTDIARELGRPVDGVRHQAMRLNIRAPKQQRKEPEPHKPGWVWIPPGFHLGIPILDMRPVDVWSLAMDPRARETIVYL